MHPAPSHLQRMSGAELRDYRAELAAIASPNRYVVERLAAVVAELDRRARLTTHPPTTQETRMTDERAVQLANLLAEYAAESVREGATFAEVKDWTIGETVGDIVDTTPQYLLDQLHPLTEDLA